MAEVAVRNLENQVVEKLEVSDAVFNYTASETLVWEAVNAFRASQRKGTHSTKGRSQIRGSNRKLWRQKGTGRARVGRVSSPVWRSGGVVFGPRPRSYQQSLPKKKRRGALKAVLTDRLKRDSVKVVDAFQLETPKTRDFAGVLAKLEVSGKVLLVDDRENRNLYLGSRNLPQVKLVPTLGLNVYDLLYSTTLLITKRSILELQEMLQR